MPDVIDYDTTNTSIGDNADLSTTPLGFSFTSASTSGVLSDVKVVLGDDQAATDGGSFTVYLYDNQFGSPGPGGSIATLGVIQDNSLNANGSPTLVDLSLSSNLTLAPNTRY